MRLDFGLLRCPRHILFGEGQIKALGAMTAALGKKVLVCTDARLAGLPLMQTILADLQAHGCTPSVFADTQAELPRQNILDCVQQYQQATPEVVIGLGGGSCMDMAKLVSLSLSFEGDLADFYGEFQVPADVIPIVAVPTTAGTGAEVTPVAVLADPRRDTKIGISSDKLIPHTAISDPALTLSCPANLTAISGADALAHAIEAYTLIRNPATPDLPLKQVFVGKNGLSDIMALAAVQHILPHLETAVKQGDNLSARSHVMLGSTLAGLAFGSAGTSAAHAIQYPVGAATKTPHGLGIGVLLPYVMDYNCQAAKQAYAILARQTGIATAADGDEVAARALIAEIRSLFAKIGIPKTLQDIGVQAQDIAKIAELSLNAKRLVMNNPTSLDYDAMLSITEHAFEGKQR